MMSAPPPNALQSSPLQAPSFPAIMASRRPVLRRDGRRPPHSAVLRRRFPALREISAHRRRIVDPEADQPVARSLWPGMYFSPVTNVLWEARSKMFEEVGGAGASGKAAPPPESELVPRSPSRSRTSIFYKFSSDYVLREQCRNPWNEIRMGKLVEDLDALAGTICYRVNQRALNDYRMAIP